MDRRGFLKIYGISFLPAINAKKSFDIKRPYFKHYSFNFKHCFKNQMKVEKYIWSRMRKIIPCCYHKNIMLNIRLFYTPLDYGRMIFAGWIYSPDGFDITEI